MAVTLTLNDRILTLTDGTETSSVDLSNVRGDIGVRGVQGFVGEEEVKQWVNNEFADIRQEEVKQWVNEAVADIPSVTEEEVKQMIDDAIAEIPSAEGVYY